jgi:hypothetical protein
LSIELGQNHTSELKDLLVIVNISIMKKHLWLLLIPILVFLAGAWGNKEQSEILTLPPTSVTYSEIAADVGEDAGYIPVQMHKPFTRVLLPAKKADIPDKEIGRLSVVGLSDVEQDSLDMISAMDGNEAMGPNNKKRREKGFLSPRKENDRIDGPDNDGLFEEINGGWGNGWLGEAIFSEEKRARKEADANERLMESETSWRDSFISGSGRSSGMEINNDRLNRSRNGLQFERNTDTKSSLRIEPWKIKGK